MTEPVTGDLPATLGDGRYEIRGVLGQGGMAAVFRAWDRRLRVERAIKLLSPAFSDKAPLRRRFETEARTMARLSHPNIAAVHDVGEDDGQIYMVMEIVEGGSVSDRVHEQGCLAPREAVRVAIAVLRALDVAHAHGVVHRDIKPHNILLTRDGTPKVTDFGIAHVTEDDSPSLTKTGSIIGTWAFMSPEQRAGAKGIDGRTDVYAVGATLVSLLTGDLPGDLFVSELHDRLLAPVPLALRPVVARATRYGVDDRYASAAEMAAALVAILEKMPPDDDGAVVGSLPSRPVTAAEGSGSNETMAQGALSLAGEEHAVERPLPGAPRVGRGLVALGVAVALGLAVAVAWGLARPPAQPAADAAPAEVSATPAEVAVSEPPPLAAPEATTSPTVESTPTPGAVVAPRASRPSTSAPAAKSTASPAVATSPARGPEPVTTASVASTPAPPAELVAAGPARFRVSGDADGVWLVAGDRRYPPGEVPAGTYAIEAGFSGHDPVAAGKVTLGEGESRTIKCDGAFMKCR